MGTFLNHIVFVAQDCHAFLQSLAMTVGIIQFIILGTFFNYTVLQTTHKTNISRQKYNLQAQCLYGEFEGLLHHNCNEGISSAPQLKNKQNNLTQTKQPVIAVRGLGIFPKVSFAYYYGYFF